MHVAGHYVEAEDLRVDTHGADVCDPVWQLLAAAYRHCGVKPTVLERDFNIPPLDVLLQEVAVIRRLQGAAQPPHDRGRRRAGVEERDLEELQRRFAAHLRDPARRHAAGRPRGPAPAGLPRAVHQQSVGPARRHLSRCCTRSSDPSAGHRLVRDFYRDHRCQTPLFLEVPREFVDYLGDERADAGRTIRRSCGNWRTTNGSNWRLASTSRDLDAVRVDPDGDLLAGVPVLSPLAWPLAYRFPVHRLGPQFLPDAPPAEPSVLRCLPRSRSTASASCTSMP